MWSAQDSPGTEENDPRSGQNKQRDYLLPGLRSHDVWANYVCPEIVGGKKKERKKKERKKKERKKERKKKYILRIKTILTTKFVLKRS